MISIIIYNCTVFLLREFGYVSSDCMQLKKTSYTVNSCMVSLLCEFLCVSLVPGCRRMFLNKLNSWKVCFQCDPAYGTLSFWHYLGNRGKSSVFFEIQHVLLCELSYGISDHLDEQMIWNILYNCRVFLLCEFGYVSSAEFQLKTTSYTVNSYMVSLLCEFLCVSLGFRWRKMFLNKWNSWMSCFPCDPACGTLSCWHYLKVYYKLNRCKISVFCEFPHVAEGFQH